MTDPADHADCNLSRRANDAHFISDGKGDVVLDVPVNATNVPPDNRAWYEPGRLMSAGGVQFSTAARLRRARELRAVS